MKESGQVFVMCAPRNFGVEYVLNPWMAGNVGRVSSAAAMRQWTALHDAISGIATVEVADPVPGLPDMVFAANGGLVAGDVFVPSRFLHPQRQGEAARYSEWFRERGHEVEPLRGNGVFEGQGDALLQPGSRLLWAAYGIRTSLESHRDLADLLKLEVLSLRLVDERFYHLDVCFCPLPGGRAFYYPGAFDHRSLELIRSRFSPEDRHEVSEADALAFACNAVVAGKTVITNAAGVELSARLRDWGFEVVACPVSEFILAGGAVKCLALQATLDFGSGPGLKAGVSDVHDRLVALDGHLLDTGLMSVAMDTITGTGGSFAIEAFQAGLRRESASSARVRVFAPSRQLDEITAHLLRLGATVVEEEVDARLELVAMDGVAPGDFYSTSIYPTDVRVGGGKWHRALAQRMDAVLAVDEPDGGEECAVRCTLMRDLKAGQKVVCGVAGIRTHVAHAKAAGEEFSFMSSGISSERRVELAVEEVAWEMERSRRRGGRIVVVAGPVVVHTGAGRHVAGLIRMGYVQALLGGNAIAVHDIEQALFGTSLGVDLKRGVGVPGGHRHHLKAINLVRSHGGIANAVERGVITGGIMYECVRNGVPFALAGSIRDDGPLPETMMDLIRAQREYARLIEGADIVLMLCSMLHAIGTGNMTPSGVRLICVDISPAVVTKLADRGSLETVGIVTDVGLFLNLLVARLGGRTDGPV